jgi:exodeoxyribonuclease V alpha subunit
MLAIDGGHVEAALDALRASERIVAEDEAIYLSRLHAAECQTASELARLVAGECRRVDDIEHCLQAFEREQGISLAPDQRRAIVAAARHKLVVITGGPGVGKTTIVRAIVNAFDLARLDVRLAAPTGRAARRLGEATSFEASTIHRLLEFEPRTGTFQRNARNRLELDVLIVDEASMVDVPLAAALLAALPSHARLVIVGDTDQLPSVGPGAFLRDLLETDHVPRVRLTEVFRQAAESGIVRNAYRILSGVQPESASADDPDADFYVIERSDPDRAAELVQTLVVSRIPRRFGLDPRRDIQVLTPMHKGSAGTHALNTELQKALNGSGPALEVRGQSLRVGDKVMQTKNDYDRDVFNGDIGSIVSLDIEGRTLEATFDDRTVAYDDTAMDALQLAYATSIHKSQGSEYKAVVIPLLTSHFVMLSRHLVYTAVTRAKRLCVLVADPRALRLALAEARREQRLTRLTQRLDEALRS